MNEILSKSVPLLTILSLIITVVIFVMTYRRKIAYEQILLANVRDNMLAQKSRVEQIDTSLNSIGKLLDEGIEGKRNIPRSELIAALDDVISSIKLLDESVFHLKEKNFSNENKRKVLEISVGQQELKSLVDNSLQKLAGMISMLT